MIIPPIITCLILVQLVKIKKGSMVEIMDNRNSSKEPGGYLKKVKNNDMVQALRGIQPRSS
jgi:divalent metal cation (Fe/Co/Zn/Cd) transporter